MAGAGNVAGHGFRVMDSFDVCAQTMRRGCCSSAKDSALDSPAAVAGASLVAFGAPRMNQLQHQQLLPFFFPLLALYALARLAGDLSLGRRATLGYWLVAIWRRGAVIRGGVCGVVHNPWSGIGGGCGAGHTALPQGLAQGIECDAWAMAVAMAGGVVLLQPFVASLSPGCTRGAIAILSVVAGCFIPTNGPGSKWAPVTGSGAGWPLEGWPYKGEFLNAEHFLGIGWLTSIACVAGLYLGRKWPMCPLAAATAFIVLTTTTYLPGITLAILATAVVSYCMAGLYHEIDRPGLRLTRSCRCAVSGAADPVSRSLCDRAGRDHGQHLRAGDVCNTPAPARQLHGARHGALGHQPEVVRSGADPIRCQVGRPLCGASGMLPVASPLGNWNRFTGGAHVVSVRGHIPSTAARVLGGLAAAPISVALTAPQRYRPPSWMLFRAMLIALPFLALFYGRDSLWLSYNEMIPGGVAIRAIGRVVLILLVPAALGLACLVQYLDQRRVAILSWDRRLRVPCRANSLDREL